MSAERRFQAGFEEEATDEPGLTLDEAGAVHVVAPGGARRDAGGLILKSKRVVTAAEMHTLNVASVELVPAPGAGRMILPISFVAKLHVATEPFMELADISIAFGDSPETVWATCWKISNSYFTEDLANPPDWILLPHGSEAHHNDGTWDPDGQSNTQDAFEDVPLLLMLPGGVDPIEGGAGNTLTIAVLYSVLDFDDDLA